MPNNEAVQMALNAIDHLLRRFMFERYLYLMGTVIGFALTIYYAIRLIDDGPVSSVEATMLLGSSGLITMASSRISVFFNRSFKLIERLIVPDGPAGEGGA